MAGDGAHGMYDQAPALPASRLVPPPRRARRLARALLTGFAAGTLFLMLVPWQQNVSGSGRVLAYAPVERQQPIDAPITGRIVRWLVLEGQVVAAGEPLVELSDNDPELVSRLDRERSAFQTQVETYEARVRQMDEQVAAFHRARTEALNAAHAKVAQAEQKLLAARQKLDAEEAGLETARLQSQRQVALGGKGLVSQRDLELVSLAEVKARTDRDAAAAEVRAAERALAAEQAELGKVRAEADAKVESAAASRSSAAADLDGARARVVRLGTDIARQETRLVTAPRRGTIIRVLAYQGGQQVKQGDVLALLVPEVSTRAVELWVDGNDAAIISPGRHVRLQFEGWPAVQFSGWPSVAVGTFGGEVAFVDAASNEQGDFRVVVVADEESDAWPSARFLRQGNRAKGWILLDEVSVGYELWRRFNGFPPATDIAKIDQLERQQGSKNGGKGK